MTLHEKGTYPAMDNCCEGGKNPRQARPELLAPAGGVEALRAAVENGADAVYIGGQAFSARAGAANFSHEELVDAVQYAHLRGVKVFAAVNTLIDNSEIDELLDYVHFLYNSGIDAVIIQDLGAALLLHEVLPELHLHASTQMTILSSAGVKLAQQMGFERVVLARETSLKDIEGIYQATGADLEVFVHGALCICYSGQCLMSSLIGGRSGNRGNCAQPCRMGYELVERGKVEKVSSGEMGQHLLSPKDLNLLDHLGELTLAGVSSLKVEGRMKRAEYVATVIRHYRSVLDRVQKGEEKGTEAEHRELAQIFNRDFTSGYLRNKPGFDLMSYKRPNNRGVQLGRVVRFNQENGRIVLKLDVELNIGDGIEVWVNRGREGVYVRQIWQDDIEVESAPPGAQVMIEFPGLVSAGDRVFKTHDELLIAKARLSYQESKGTRKIPLEFTAEGRAGEQLKLTVKDSEGHTGIAKTEARLEEAIKRPLTEEYLTKQLDRLGNTAYTFSGLNLNLQGNLIVPVSEINEVRRKAVEEISKARIGNREVLSKEVIKTRFEALKVKSDHYSNSVSASFKSVSAETIKLAVSVGDLDSLYRAADSGADIIYFGGDSFRSKQTLGSEDLARGAAYCQKKGIQPVIRLPRMVKECKLELLERSLRNAREAGVKTIQVADLGSLYMAVEFGDFSISTDYTLNVFNDFSLIALKRLGVSMTTMSPELSFQQLEGLNFRAQDVELLIYGALEVMISEYCAPGAMLGGRNDQCSKPCLQKKFSLKDRIDFAFPVEPDDQCRMHIFNVKELNMLEHLQQLVNLKPASLRLELQKDSSEIVGTVTKIYRHELSKAISEAGVFRPDQLSLERLAAMRPKGYTKGHYYRGVVK